MHSLYVLSCLFCLCLCMAGTGGRAQGELCSAGTDGRPGIGAEPRECGVQDLLPPASARRGRSTAGVSSLLLQVSEPDQICILCID